MRQVWKTERERGAYRVLVGNLSERDEVQVPGTDKINIKFDIEEIDCGLH